MPVRPEDKDVFAPERAFLVAVDWGRPRVFTVDESLSELASLVEAAGAEVVARVVQKRERPDAALLIGRGKVDEIAVAVKDLQANLVVFDEPLSPAQKRNLEERLDVRVIDRPTVILAIFARRARTNEGRFQVELAQLQYELPRLRGWGGELSRTAGGIGTRGPGETKLESDRRRVVKRIALLKEKIAAISKRRALERSGRAGLPAVALVGYTNSGKTTLWNRLTGAEAFAADQPFATLDPFVKRVRLPSGRLILAADTVGFIANLPLDLLAAFRATMEEVRTADALVVVHDLTAANVVGQASVAEGILTFLGAREKPRIDVFNKLDLASKFEVEKFLELGFTRPLAISALTGAGCDALLRSLDDVLAQNEVRIVADVPFGPLLNEVYERGRVWAREERDGIVRVTASVAPDLARRLAPYAVS